jgi:hypothetical protein
LRDRRTPHDRLVGQAVQLLERRQTDANALSPYAEEHNEKREYKRCDERRYLDRIGSLVERQGAAVLLQPGACALNQLRHTKLRSLTARQPLAQNMQLTRRSEIEVMRSFDLVEQPDV